MTMNPSISFEIKNQFICRTDTFQVVAASRNYLHAEFVFLTGEWNGVTKTALFEYSGGVKKMLLENDRCMVPWEALAKPGILKVSVFGGDRITASQAIVRVGESGYKDCTETRPPTPDAYERILATANRAKELAEDVRRDMDAFADRFPPSGGDTAGLEQRLEQLETQMTALTHEHIQITQFTLSRSTVELGESAQITIHVAVDKPPAGIRLSKGAEVLPLDFSGTSGTAVAQGISADTTFNLAVTDDMDHEITQSGSVSVCNGVYYGVGAGESAQIGSLTKKLQGGRGVTFSVTAGEDAFIYYACPARYGTPKFTVGGFEGGFGLVQTLDFTNASGYTEAYQLWRSANADLGSVTVTVS